MIKLMFLMKRRAGMTPAEFRDYYENRHAPFMLSMSGRPAVYRRNYVTGPDERDYDVVTEIVYATQADFAAAQAAMADPENARRMAEDQARFLEPGSVRAFTVDCVEDA